MLTSLLPINGCALILITSNSDDQNNKRVLPAICTYGAKAQFSLLSGKIPIRKKSMNERIKTKCYGRVQIKLLSNSANKDSQSAD